MTEFILKCVDKLKGEFGNAPLEDQINILKRANELLDGADLGLLLSLSLRSFHVGNDDEAFSFLQKAMTLNDKAHDARRVEVFLSAAVGHQDALQLCADLVHDFPDDSWAKEMQKKLLEGRTDSLTLPAISGDWWLAGC